MGHLIFHREISFREYIAEIKDPVDQIHRWFSLFGNTNMDMDTKIIAPIIYDDNGELFAKKKKDDNFENYQNKMEGYGYR